MRESERKRLVGLINTQQDYGTKFFCEENSQTIASVSNEIIADYLLENNVVIPPVKVGQIVYFVARNSGKPIGTIDELEIVMIGKTESGFYAKAKLGENTFDIIPHFEIDNYTFFTSREDAEKALKGEDK